MFINKMYVTARGEQNMAFRIYKAYRILSRMTPQQLERAYRLIKYVYIYTK